MYQERLPDYHEGGEKTTKSQNSVTTHENFLMYEICLVQSHIIDILQNTMQLSCMFNTL